MVTALFSGVIGRPFQDWVLISNFIAFKRNVWGRGIMPLNITSLIYAIVDEEISQGYILDQFYIYIGGTLTALTDSPSLMRWSLGSAHHG